MKEHQCLFGNKFDVLPSYPVIYRIAGYFRREFIFGYFEEAFLFEIKFLVTAFLQKLIPATKIERRHVRISVCRSVRM